MNESTYRISLLVLEVEPLHKFKIFVATAGYNDDQKGLACNLVFTYKLEYPDEAPEVEIEDAVNLADTHESRLLNHIKTIIEENLGMEMIFSLVSAGQEWLNERYDEQKQEEEDERVRKLMEAEDLEQKKFEGTRVTVETFMKWRTEFEESTGVAEKRDKNLDSKKATGKELFLRDNTLIESDLKFLLEAGDSIENVKIDETLFQNIADLDLGSEDEDDEDWVPGKDD